MEVASTSNYLRATGGHGRAPMNFGFPQHSPPMPTTQAQAAHQSQSGSSQYSGFSSSSSHHHHQHHQQYTPRSSASTNAASLSGSTLMSSGSGPPPPPTPPQQPGGPIVASNSVLNTRAGTESSLFQICVNLRARLMNVPGVRVILMEEEEDADEDTDPVTLLWRTFRRGYPLMTLYNALGPAEPLYVDEARVKDVKRPQAATFKFLQACIRDLRFPSEDCFIISDLYGDDTTGFVKVASVVNRVLDVLVLQGVIRADQDEAATRGGAAAGGDLATGLKKSQREHIIAELVNTERTYVKHLELLEAFKKLVAEKGIINGDTVHAIFFNLNALLDFQRRFLIRIEQTNAQPESEQNWGKLFVLYRDAFKVYEPYIANQDKAAAIALREFDKLRETGGPIELQQMVESPTVLSSFLMKPFQRLSKYPLLLMQLRDKGGLDEVRRADIEVGIEAASGVLQRTNAAMAEEQSVLAVEELKSRVEDWKGHNIEAFGPLLLHGTFTVLKGEGSSTKNAEREYKIYLFQMILLCCKEVDMKKDKNRQKRSDFTGKPKLQLKGRIFMQNVTDTLKMSKPGSYTCQIFWKGDPGIENFLIRFPSEELMGRWADQVDTQRRAWREHARNSNNSRQTSTSQTEFTYMRDQNIPNPYAETGDDDDDDDVDDGASTPGGYGYMNGRNDSSSSLGSRARAGTGDSIFANQNGRMAPPRFPMLSEVPAPALQLQTRAGSAQGGHMSPGEQQMDSYFSPTSESPISTRTSSSSTNLYGFRQQQVPNGWHPADEHARYTAPAMGRSTPPAAHARNMQRPSLPPHAHSAYPASTSSRLRSASSPDIQNPLGRPQDPPPVPIPNIPAHYAYNPSISNRSNPNLANNLTTLPTRAATQSPSLQRDRMGPPRGQMPTMDGPSYYDPRYGAIGGSRGPPPLERAYTSADPRAQFPSQSAPPPPPLPLQSSMASAPSTPPVPATPSQLKVKLHCPSAGSSFTLVVPTNISYQSLKDRIDAKLQRSTNVSLSSGAVKLKYLDDGDYISIQSDEDVQTAFEMWKDQQGGPAGVVAGQMGEIELYCQ